MMAKSDEQNRPQIFYMMAGLFNLPIYSIFFWRLLQDPIMSLMRLL